MAKPPDVPDLDLPGPGVPSQKPSSARSVPARPASNDDDDLFGGGIERGGGSDPIAPSRAAGPPGKSIAIEFGASDDDPFGDGGIERGGEMSMPPASGRHVASSRAPGPASMNLDVAYRRLGASAPAEQYEASFLEKAGGRALALVGLAVVLVPIFKYVHRAGRFNALSLAPHAFDASSTVQSGGLSGVMLIVSMTVGYLGIKARGRSWAMIISAAVFLLTCLAMVTVALVSLEETPSPADGARLVPYAVPVAVMLLGLGIAGRGQESYLDGGTKRALPLAWGVVGGLVMYAGIALSAY